MDSREREVLLFLAYAAGFAVAAWIVSRTPPARRIIERLPSAQDVSAVIARAEEITHKAQVAGKDG